MNNATRETAAVCQESVTPKGSHWSWSHPCGRPVVEDGLCKLHLGVKKRREEKNRRWNDEREKERAIRIEAERLSAHLGVLVTAYYDGRRYDGRFVVPGDWLRAL